MRRILACGLAMMFMLGLAAPRVSAATAGRKVDGTLTGPGGFRVTGCGDVTKIGSGTFHAAGLGNGTYPFTVCIEVFPVITFDGTITLTTAGGATLTGAIGGTGAPEPTLDVVITGGAKQFASAAGALTVGPLVESDFTNCGPNLICQDWRDTGPITGTITRISPLGGPVCPGVPA